MSEDYPFLAQWQRRIEAEARAAERNARKLLKGPQNHTNTYVSNEYARLIMLKDAQVICINGPPGVDRQRVVIELVAGLGFEPVSVSSLVSDEIADGRSPYVAMLQTPVLNRRLPDRMYVEVLSKHLQKRVAHARRKFLITDFPGNESQAAIFEEDASLIRAFVLVEGRKPQQVSQDAWNTSMAACRPVFEKLEKEGRAFKVGEIRLLLTAVYSPDTQINIDKEPRGLTADLTALIKTLKSMSFVAKVLLAEDIFKPPPLPPGR
ncbi:MAG: hypothetical protein Q9213_005389 [Squamulea squamosa]